MTRASPFTATTVWLLDANLLIALTQQAHIHHAEAHAWFVRQPDRLWATCALTQLAFVRLTSNPQVVGEGITPEQAMQALVAMTTNPQHAYWHDSPEPLAMATLNSAAPVANAASDTPAGEPAKQLVADLASDHPDWLLTTAAPAVSAATVYRQVTFKLRRLPHPFPERPQRPPQIANTRV